MIRRIIFLVPVLITACAAATVQLEFGSAAANFTRVLPLPNGDRLLIGSQPTSIYQGPGTASRQRTQIALMALGPVGFPPRPGTLNPVLGGSGNDIPNDAAIDSNGNIWIVGQTDSDDFNLVNPIVSQKIPYRTAGFIMELDPTGSQLLFATYLAGQQRPQLNLSYLATYATVVTADGSGNIYVGGTTNESDFPTTPGAYLTGKGGADSFTNTFFYSFLLKIASSGKLVYSTELGTGSSQCVGGSSCIANESTSANVASIIVDAGGIATVAGTLGGSFNPGQGYVSRLSADGTKLIWTTPAPNFVGIQSLFMTQEPGGNLDLFGMYAPPLKVGVNLPAPRDTPRLFAAQLKNDGSGFVYLLSDLGVSKDAAATGIVSDASGNVWLAGTDSSTQFPALAGVPNLGSDFVMRLDFAAGNAKALYRLPRGVVTAPPALDAAGNLLLLGAQSAVLTLSPAYAFDSPAIVAFANSASGALNTGLYPGALINLYGFDLMQPQNSQTQTQMQIDGFTAPLLFANATQTNVQVPFEIANVYQVPQIQVTSGSGTVSLLLPSSQSIGIFTVDGTYAAALNQDGTVNSSANPAARGSIVSLFGTGAQWPSGLLDGASAATAMPLDQELNKLQMVDGPGTPLSIFYAGAAPGLIDGAFQINVQLPPGVNLPLTLKATGSTIASNQVWLYLK